MCNHCRSGKATCVCIYSLRYPSMQCTCATLYCHLWSAQLYNVFSTFSHKRHDFRWGWGRGGGIEHKMCVSKTKDHLIWECEQLRKQRQTLNHLTPNDHFSGRTAPLNSRFYIFIFIQQIYVLNILNMLHTLCFFLFKMPFIS